MEGKPLRVERAGSLSIGLLALGMLILLVSYLDISGEWGTMGPWASYTIIIGIGMTMAGGIWLHGHLRRVAEFERLLEERSKASFIKRQEELEYLAWRLPSSYEDRLMEKKEHFRLR